MRKKTEERRQAILDAAERVFQQVGFERASMAQICSEVGFSKATLYSYFNSKDELFFDVMMAAASAEFEATKSLLDHSSDDARAVLLAYGRQYLTVLYSPRVQAIRRLMATEGNRGDLGRRCFEFGPEKGQNIVAGYLKTLMDKGVLREARPLLLSQQLHSLLEAEWIEQFMFGVLGELSASQFAAATGDAVDTFLRAWRPA
ncbi:TetR/AcrR family transcriptional regulator [Thalassolituus sp. LLYu03]|uniref:TetR/AcrR family transcriptional regulator n=1 Tax=Thalassolituus sp. LLYu03 TaxID=3421656 RepID=UPI003D27F79C